MDSNRTTPPVLKTKRLTLRMPSVTEAQAAVDFVVANKDHLASTSPIPPVQYFSLEHWQKQLATNFEEFQNDQSFRLSIFENEAPSVIIGSINFVNFVRRAAFFCSLGYSLAGNKQGKGYMTEGAGAAIEYVFQVLNMHRILANYMPRNEPSGRVLERLGFHKEGYAKQLLYINGVWEDHVMTGLINPNWKKP